MNDLVHDLANARPFDLAQERVEALARAAEQWESAVAEIPDADTARRADDFLSQIGTELKILSKGKAAEKAPHIDANQEIELRYGPVFLLLTVAKSKVEPKLRAWLAKQRGANPDTRPAVRGTYSSRARSLRVLWHAEVDDVVMAFAHYQEHPKVIEVLTELASAEARASSGKADIPGCRVLSREIAA